jgi:hypothetical protein
MVLVAIVIGAGLVLTVGALVFRGHRERTTDVTEATPTTATTAGPGPGLSTTTTAPGPQGITYEDPNEIFQMTVGADWTRGTNGIASSPNWLAPVPGGTAQINPLLSSSPGSLAEFVRSSRSRMDQGALYDSTGEEPTTLTDGTPATIVHYRSATGALLEGRMLVVVNGQWGMTMLVQCPPDGADACFAALDPFIKSVVFATP